MGSTNLSRCLSQQGNHYCARDYGNGSNAYHYSNTDGSYYYSNPNGSVSADCHLAIDVLTM